MSLNSTITAARRGYANLKHLWARATRREDAGRRGVNLALLMANKLTQREKEVTLPYLTPQRAVQLFEHYRRGEFAPVMLEWEQMEQYDDTLFPTRAKRIAALKKMRWVVEADADAVGNNAELQQLADKQRAAALAALAKVENLDRILPEMGEADFGGICAIERTGSLETREVWRVIAPWHLYQPVPGGEIFYNAEADDVPMLCDELEPERVIIRRAPAANIPVMFLILRKSMTNEQWAAFIATYGLPNIFFELPPAIDERRAAELDAIVQRISSDGRGTMPNGAKLHVVETQQHDGALFEAHVKECKDAIITIVLGGTLTMETEAGSGTLAGNAHADSFAELCEGSAHDIGACVDEQFVRPLLRKRFPGAPILVHFDYRPMDAKDAQKVAQTLATLSQAGWKVSAETASEMLGFAVEESATNSIDPTSIYALRAAGYAPEERSLERATGWPLNPVHESGAEVVGNRASGAGNSTLPTSEAEPSLTQGEMDALAAIGRAMDPEYLLPKTREIAGKLAEAMREGKRAQEEGGEVLANKKKDDRPCHDKNCRKPGHGGNASIGSKFSAKTTLGTDEDLKKLGVDKGELFIDKKILKKLIGAKNRLNASQALRVMRSYLKQPRIIGKPYTRGEGAGKVTRVNIYKKHPSRVSYIVVDLDGPKKGGITTYIPKATATHIKETGIDFS